MALPFDLYVKSTLIQFDDGTALLEREKIEYEPTVTDLHHIVQQDDIPTQLAWRFYTPMDQNHAPKYWRYIADVNDFMNPLDITEYIGTEIIIPDFNAMKLME